MKVFSWRLRYLQNRDDVIEDRVTIDETIVPSIQLNQGKTDLILFGSYVPPVRYFSLPPHKGYPIADFLSVDSCVSD